MSNVEMAELKLRELNGGKFQVLASRYVGCKYAISSVHHSGRSFGTEETTIGTPDCYLAKPNGHFIYIECGKKASRSATLKKLRKDVKHCTDYEASHPEAGVIDEIVCCYGFPRLSSGDLTSIKAMDDRVTLIGPEEIAEACVSKYPWLARDYLGLPIGSGAFLDAQAFAERNHNDRFAPDLDQALIGRDGEIAEISQACHRSQAVLLYGSSGCGKTKLALETCKKLAGEQHADLYVVIPSRQNIYEDLRVLLTDNRVTYLLLDDANQLAGLKDVVDYALTRPNLKLVVTCRNYARFSVEKELKSIKEFEEVGLNPLPIGDFIRILESEMGLDEAGSSGRIASIVKGNLRLAFLLAESGKDGKNVTTMQELLEVAYKDKLDDMPVTERRTIAIASILGPHMTMGNEQLDELLQRFGLAWEEYISSCHALHDRELLDATPGFEAVSFEEQNLRDYFLYYSLVDEPVIQLRDLWSMGGRRGLCVNSYLTVAEVFPDTRTRQQLVDQLKALLEGIHSDREALKAIETFGPVLGRAGFSRLCSIILSQAPVGQENISYRTYDFKESHQAGSFNCLELSALSTFLESDSLWLPAVKLVFDLLKRVKLSDADTEELFERRLHAGSFRMRGNVQMESETMRLLEEGGLSEDGSAEAVFRILFAKGVLSDVLHYTQALSVREIGFGEYHLTYSGEIVELRRQCVQVLLREFERDSSWSYQIRKVLLGYRHYPDGDVRFSQATYELITQEVLPTLRFSSLAECEEVCSFIKAAAYTGIDVRDSMLAGLSTGKQFAISTLNVEGFPNYDALAALAEDAASLVYSDWEELIALLEPKDQHVVDAHVLDGVLAIVLGHSGVDVAIKEMITRGVATSAVYLPRTIDACAAQYLECFGMQMGRVRIVDEVSSHMSYWLTCFDQHAIDSGIVPAVGQLTESLDKYGEVLAFETVCQMEGSRPGTFAPYIRELAQRVELIEGTWAYYLPYSLGELNNCMNGACDTPQNWIALADLLCPLSAFANQEPSEEVIGEVIRRAPLRLPLYLASVAKRHSYAQPNVPWKYIFEVVGIGSAMEAIGSLLEVAKSRDYQMEHACRHLILDASAATESLGMRAEFDDWVCQRVTGVHNAMVDVLAAAITAFDFQHRLSLVIRCASDGVDVSLFGRMAFGFPFNGISWSDSEQPLIRRRLEYCRRVESRLLEKGLFAYLPTTSEAIKHTEGELHSTVVREFVDPYLRNAGAQS